MGGPVARPQHPQVGNVATKRRSGGKDPARRVRLFRNGDR